MCYDLYSVKTGRIVGHLNEQGELNCADLQAARILTRIVGRDLLTREDEENLGEVVEEGSMCYMGLRSVRPQDADYVAVLVRQLPILSDYEARPSRRN